MRDALSEGHSTDGADRRDDPWLEVRIGVSERQYYGIAENY